MFLTLFLGSLEGGILKMAGTICEQDVAWDNAEEILDGFLGALKSWTAGDILFHMEGRKEIFGETQM